MKRTWNLELSSCICYKPNMNADAGLTPKSQGDLF